MWEEMSKEGHSFGGESLALSSKIFSKKGSDWPRISIAVYLDRNVDRFKVVCEEKTEKGWWKATNVPAELVPDFIKVLHEARRKYNDKRR